MPGPFPLPTLAPTINAAGITVVSLEDTIASLQQSYRNIYGQDTDLASDTQDGAWIGIFGQALYDTGDAIAGVFNGFSPTNAQGAALASLVKINGLRKQPSTNSTAPCSVVGQAGTIIPSGIVSDSAGNQWALPANVEIPNSGAIASTLTCLSPGAITLANGASTNNNGGLQFITFIPGWQSVTTTGTTAPGAPVETDAALRQRQAISTSLPAQTPKAAILANVAEVAGVEEAAIYENDGSTTDGNGVPAHSISVVALGGQTAAIATAISDKKPPGAGTYGTTSVVVIDQSGVPSSISFDFLTEVPAYFILGITPLTGYLSTTGTLAIAAVAAALNALSVGENAYVNKLFAAANLSGDAALSVGGGATQPQLDVLSATYNVNYIYLGTAPNPGTQTDIVVTYSQQVVSAVNNGSIVIL